MNDFLFVPLSFLISLGIVLYAVPKVIRIAYSLKLLDYPNGRSAAKRAVPTLGGVAIFISFVLSTAIGLHGHLIKGLFYIFTALLLMFFTGLKDDILNISAFKKIIAQLVAVAILIFFADLRFTHLHGFLGIGEIGYATSVLLTAFAMVGFINAFNLIDGIDGLASGLGLLSSVVFGSWFFISGHFDYAVLSFSLAGALAGFFYYNVYGRKYKIFMGDTGSLLLGTALSVLVIKFNELNIDPSTPYAVKSSVAVSFAVLIYPVIDTIRVFMIRILCNKSPFIADKNHIHHRLLVIGLSHRETTYTIIAINTIIIVSVFAFQGIGIEWLIFSNFIICSILIMVPALIIQKRGLINEDDPNQHIMFPL